MGSLIELARKLRPLVVKAAQNLDDKDASEAPELYDHMQYDGGLIRAGTKINWNGAVKKAAVDLWDTVKNNPDNTPTLWVDIAYKQGVRIIPDTITVTTAFAKGEQGWWNDKMYESLIDANVYTPEQYPAGWALVS